MTKFLFSYRAPKDYTMGQPETMSTWATWFAGIGTSLTEIGAPVSESAALALAQGCPVLPEGGGVEVGVLIDPPADSGSPA
jgi:hypothetical protein